MQFGLPEQALPVSSILTWDKNSFHKNVPVRSHVEFQERCQLADGATHWNEISENPVIATVRKLQHTQKRIIFGYGTATRNTTLKDL